MFKAIYLTRRNPALSQDEFWERWKQHSALTGTTRRIRPYYNQVVQCGLSDAFDAADGTDAYDGANLLGLVDRSGGYGVFDEPEHRDIMLPDEIAIFAQPIRDCTLVTEEHVVRPGGFSRHLVLHFLKRAETVTEQQLFDQWLALQDELHNRPAGAELVRRSVINKVVETPPTGYPFDLVTETWFADAEAMRRYLGDASIQDAFGKRRAELCDDGLTISFVARVNHSRPAIED